MKKLLLLLGVLAFTFTSCGDKKKEEVKKEVEPVKVEESAANAKDQQIAMGEKLFTDKTCIICHQVDTKVVGPSIKDIVNIYEEQGGNMVQFLKGNAAAIVDTDPAQVAIMKANLDGFVKNLTPEDLQALTAYMRHAAK